MIGCACLVAVWPCILDPLQAPAPFDTLNKPAPTPPPASFSITERDLNHIFHHLHAHHSNALVDANRFIPILTLLKRVCGRKQAL